MSAAFANFDVKFSYSFFTPDLAGMPLMAPPLFSSSSSSAMPLL